MTQNLPKATTDRVGADFARDFLNTLQGYKQQQTPQDCQPIGSRTHELVEQFWRMGPPRLKGSEGPMGVEEWIRELERIFQYMDYTDTQRVSCAVFQLA